jgi:hypothetical protein
MRHVKIPADWNGEEAIAVVSFLDDVIRAVWRQHGKKIFEELSPGDAEFRCAPALPDTDEPTDDTPPF